MTAGKTTSNVAVHEIESRAGRVSGSPALLVQRHMMAHNDVE